MHIRLPEGISRGWVFRYGNTLVLTNGFSKKGARTPKAEIVRCERLRDAFLAGGRMGR